MAAFDPIKAQADIVKGLHEVHTTLSRRAGEAQSEFAKYEAEANSLMKLMRYAEEHLEREQQKLHALREAADAQH